MKKYYFLLAFSIFLLVVGLIKSVHYTEVVGNHGTGFEYGFVLNRLVLFGLIGMVSVYVIDRKTKQ